MAVNSYLVVDPSTNEAAAFDTGADCSGMLVAGANIRQVFLTHIHADHIADLDQLLKKTGATAFVSSREPLPAASPLRGLRNVSLTPHLAGPTTDRRCDAGAFALANLRAYATGRHLQAVVTPEVYDRST
jgi:glyoxylase-like metal-dependent hydrolase (beta-lactamase superfamily II)